MEHLTDLWKAIGFSVGDRQVSLLMFTQLALLRGTSLGRAVYSLSVKSVLQSRMSERKRVRHSHYYEVDVEAIKIYSNVSGML